MSRLLGQYRHWIFDLDGTLTEPVHDFAHMRAVLKIPAEADILGHIAALPEPLRQQHTERLDQLERHYARQAKSAAGLHPLLRYLQQQGMELAILTRNSRTICQLTLTTLGVSDLFPPERILGRDEAAPKPAPDGIQQLAAQWCIPARQLVMVGDYRFDLEAGRAAGCVTVHVQGAQLASWPDLADWQFSSLASLHQALLPAQ